MSDLIEEGGHATAQVDKIVENHDRAAVDLASERAYSGSRQYMSDTQHIKGAKVGQMIYKMGWDTVPVGMSRDIHDFDIIAYGAYSDIDLAVSRTNSRCAPNPR